MFLNKCVFLNLRRCKGHNNRNVVNISKSWLVISGYFGRSFSKAFIRGSKRILPVLKTFNNVEKKCFLAKEPRL